jgi:hypothetical protein
LSTSFPTYKWGRRIKIDLYIDLFWKNNVIKWRNPAKI